MLSDSCIVTICQIGDARLLQGELLNGGRQKLSDTVMFAWGNFVKRRMIQACSDGVKIKVSHLIRSHCLRLQSTSRKAECIDKAPEIVTSECLTTLLASCHRQKFLSREKKEVEFIQCGESGAN